MSYTTRCNAAERKAFRERYQAEREAAKRKSRYRWAPQVATCPEPALGSLAERLDIIIQRQGGRVSPVRVSAVERRWLEDNGWAERSAA